MVVGKTARTKQWVSGHQLESFSDLEAGSSDEDDSASEGGSLNGKTARNGHRGRKDLAADDDDEDGEGSRGPDPAKDWEAFEEQARRDIGTSKTSVRLQFLNERLLHHLKDKCRFIRLHIGGIVLTQRSHCSSDSTASLDHPQTVNLDIPTLYRCSLA
jgi:hypothetical protein